MIIKENWRTNLFFVSLGVLFVLTACYSTVSREGFLLARADSLMQIQPDSALSLLEAIPYPKELSSEQFARYALLLTQAHDRNYITHTDDSLIRVAVNYFDSVGDVGMRAKAHYYWGRVQKEKQNILACVRQYLTAIPLAKQAKDTLLSCLAYSNLGEVFFQEDLNDKADSCFRQAGLLAMQLKDSAKLAFTLVDIGKIHLTKGNKGYAAADSCLTRALVMAEMTDNKIVIKFASLYLSTLYSRLKAGRKAVEFAKRTISLSDTNQCFGAYMFLGDAYYKLGVYDSAKIYLMKSLPTDSYDTKVSAYMRLSDIAEIEGRADEAIGFESLVTTYQDSVRLSLRGADVISVVKDVQIHTMQQDHTLSFNRFYYVCFFFLAILITLVSLLIYKRRKHHRDVLNARIEREKIGEQLASQLEQKSIELQQSQSLLNHYVLNGTESQQLKEQIRILQDDKDQIIRSLLSNAEVYQKMHRIIGYYKEYSDYVERFDSEDWKHLITCIDPLGQFQKHLMARNESLLDEEIHLCYLAKINLSIADISIVMGCTRDNIYKKKKAIANKLSTSAKPKEWKEILNEWRPLF